MGVHSLPRSSTSAATRVAGTGALAVLALAGTGGVASAHGSDHDEHGDRAHHHVETTSWGDEDSSDDSGSGYSADEPDAACDVLSGLDLDVPGFDCSDPRPDASGLGDGFGSGFGADHDERSGSSGATDDTGSVPRSSGSSGSSTASTRPVSSSAPASSSASSSPEAAPKAAPKAAPRPAPSSAPAAKPKTTGNPVDVPGEPGTTDTLPIRG